MESLEEGREGTGLGGPSPPTDLPPFCTRKGLWGVLGKGGQG